METQKNTAPASKKHLDGRFQSAHGRPADVLMGCQTVVQLFQVSMGNLRPLSSIHRLSPHNLLQYFHATFQLPETNHVLPSSRPIEECTPTSKHQHHPHYSP